METRLHQTLTALALFTLLGGCSAPTVNLSTAEPIVVDINMRLDVYQHSPTNSQKPTTTAGTPAGNNTPATEAQRGNREADIQKFKNERLVGENRDGLVTIRTRPDGDYGNYIARAVEQENADRMALMKNIAEQQKTTLPEVQKRQGELWRNRSFKNEWIEEPQADGSWKWTQKQG